MNKINIKEIGQVYIMHCNDYHYVGVHKGDIFQDDYFGSGVAWQNVINKYGKDIVEREIIDTYDNQQLRDELEKYYITFYRKLYEDKLLNIADGGQGGNLGEVVNKKISENGKIAQNRTDVKEKIKKTKSTQEYKEKIHNILVGHPNYNHSHWHPSLEMREAQAIRMLGDNNPCKREDVKNKLRIARKNQKNLNLKSALGKHWYYNKDTDEELQIFEKDKPEGFELGRRPQSTKGKIYWNNGEKDILLSIDELPPKGFVRGRRTEIKYDESRNKKISEKLKGKPKSDQHKKKLSEANKGKVSPTKGKHLSEESKRKISESTKGRIPWNKGLKLKEFI